MTLGRRSPLRRKAEPLKRSTIKRSAFKSSIRTSSRARRERELDATAKRLIIALDGAWCRRCGVSHRALECHHLITKRRKHLRYDPDNLVILCAECHDWWHSHSTRAERWEWAASALPADRIARLERKKAILGVQTADLKMIEADLERRLTSSGAFLQPLPKARDAGRAS